MYNRTFFQISQSLSWSQLKCTNESSELPKVDLQSLTCAAISPGSDKVAGGVQLRRGGGKWTPLSR